MSGGLPPKELRWDAAYQSGLDALAELQQSFAQEHNRLLAALRADSSELQRFASLGLASSHEALDELDLQAQPTTSSLQLWSQQWRADAFCPPRTWSRSSGMSKALAESSTPSSAGANDQLSVLPARLPAPWEPLPKVVFEKPTRSGTGSAALSRLSSRTVISNPCMPCGQRPPETAFVVNLHRLMNVHEHLDLLHEFTKSTAIAALTLVSAQSPRDLFCTAVFLVLLAGLYCDHELRYDLLSVEDLMNVVHLLPQKPDGNPNQFLQVMSVCKTRLSEWRTCVILTVTFFIICFSWYSVISAWLEPETGMMIVGELTGCEEGSETLSVQLTVLTIMYFLHALFTAIHNYETTFVMPPRRDGQVWDVRQDGLPLRCRLWGLPSMWFQTQDAKDRLLHFVDGLNPGQQVRRVFPEELAMYSLTCDDDSREELALMLQEAAFFCGKRDCSVDSISALGSIDTLSLELVFFVDVMLHDGMPHIGEYVSFRALQHSAKAVADDSAGGLTPADSIRDRLDKSRLSVRAGSPHY